MTTPDPRAVIALDLGTSAAKAGVVALDGRLRGDARAAYPLLLEGEAGRAEQDPDTWWDALCEAAGTAMAQAAAAEACATDSGMSLGSWNAPAT